MTINVHVMRSNRGAALLMTLVVLVIMTALIVEFAYAVYVDTALLGSWRSMQQLSSAAESGATFGAMIIRENTEGKKYTYPGAVNLPPYDMPDAGVSVLITLIDENSKFNINKLVHQNGEANEDEVDSFKRLLKALDMDESIADRAADWLDKDSLGRIGDSESGAKNAAMTVETEIRLIKGIKIEDCDKMAPYITVHGGGLINANAAPLPVLMSLSPDMTGDLGQRIMDYRGLAPFESPGQITKVAGLESIGIPITAKINVKGEAFRIISTATDADGLKKTIQCVTDSRGMVKYWREF